MRALVSFFAGLLIIISLYQLSFTWFVNKHESAMTQKAERFVKNNYPSAETKYPGSKDAQLLYKDSLNVLVRERTQKLLDSTKDTKITWWGTTYQKSKESELLLGLDLQGGINVTMDIALDGLIKGLANNGHDPVILKAIQSATEKKLSSDANFIDLFAQSFKELNPNASLAPFFANASRNKLKFDASDNAVISYIHGQANAAMNQTLLGLTKRIDKFGVVQPLINLDAAKGLITVELAGATDPERVNKYLQATANLQFWELYNIHDLQNSIVSADKSLQNYLNGVKDTATLSKNDSTKNDTTTSALNQNPLLRKLQFLQPTQDQKTGAQQYPAPIAQSLLHDTSTVNSYLDNPVVRNNFPANLKFLWGKQERDDNDKPVNYLFLYAIKTVPGKETAKLEGGSVKGDARQDYDPVTQDVVVEMSM